MFRVEPIAPLPQGPSRRDRWTMAVEVLLALLLNIAFIFALFVHLPVPAPKLNEKKAIPVQLVRPQQAPPKPKLQQQPKPQEQQKPKPPEPPKPKEQPKPKEEPKPQEQQKQPPQKYRESGGKDANKAPGKPPEVKAEKAQKPQAEVKKAPQGPKSEVALPDWMKKLSPGYDLPQAKMTRSAKPSSSDETDPQSSHPGEGGGDPYLNAMRDQVAANLRYPLEANGAKGVVVFILAVSRDGSIASMRMARSSGVEVLDAAVEAAIRRSNPFRPLPPDFADPTYVTAAIPIQPAGP